MDLADLRQDYMRAGLAEVAAHANPFVQFERWFEAAIAAQLPLPNAMTLATVSADGAPDARVVLLKGVDEGFLFFTSYDSRKGRQLTARPEACLVFLWAPLERQIRIEGRVERVSAVESDTYFASRPLGARRSACASKQSEVVPGRSHLEAEVEKIRIRYGDDPPRPSDWGGYRVIPGRVEFWQGRENRLHDRLRYSRSGSGWTIERLAP